MKLALGKVHTAVLAVGSLMLLLLGFLIGLVAFGVPAMTTASAPAPTLQAAAPGGTPAAASPQGQAPDAHYTGERGVDRFLDSRTRIMADDAGDTVGVAAQQAAMPILDGVADAAGEVLPGFLADQLPWMTQYARFKTRSVVADAVEGGVEETVRGGIAGTKQVVLGSRVPGGAEAAARPMQGEAGAGGAGAVGAAPIGAVPGAPPAAGPGAAAAPVPSHAPQGAFTIEFARFATPANAEAFTGELSRRGVDARVALDAGPTGRWHVVRTGRFSSQAEATEALRRLRGRGFGGTVVSQNTSGGIP
ncbi:SPOR domain-containing protein [Arenibaculum pallidiluteum]|uniref:SPOR domain-containing protein n=1 Tax=Arenibaculum pallidiluteum TaxID=2812559 RepID=UPI001A95F0D1|nr:SPOR domain-containing protein [Arenibaculum pallidiluteum]